MRKQRHGRLELGVVPAVVLVLICASPKRCCSLIPCRLLQDEKLTIPMVLLPRVMKSRENCAMARTLLRNVATVS